MTATRTQAPYSFHHRYITDAQRAIRANAIIVADALGNGVAYRDNHISIESRHHNETVIIRVLDIVVFRAEATGATIERHRPGLWESYLSNLTARAQLVKAEKAAEATRLDDDRWEPIDDSAVFDGKSLDRVA